MFAITMYYLLIVSASLMSVHSASLTKDSEAKIVDYTYTNEGNGNYYFRFETSNGITREETGTLVNVGLPNEYMSVEGFYSYTNPNGEIETVNYIADENGFLTVVPSLETAYRSDALLASLLG